MADGNNLVLKPDSQREGVAATPDDGEGAVVQRLERQHGAATADPDEAGREELGWQLAG